MVSNNTVKTKFRGKRIFIKDHFHPPGVETKIINVKVGNKYLIIELNDGRIIQVPLSWVPKLNNACKTDKNDFIFY